MVEKYFPPAVQRGAQSQDNLKKNTFKEYSDQKIFLKLLLPPAVQRGAQPH